ncbi:MAG: creatininase family protein [Deltaproteobacteria bacterium]|nr:creatininase family protein [Deltaproteobacteria bacterium]
MMLERQTWKRAREKFKRTKVALIPVGSTEQHGPHLPLGTDFITAKALAEEAAARTGAICTPVIPVGLSEHHRQFWGTLWVEAEHFRGYLRGIARSLPFHGISRIIYVNGHGGNQAAVLEVCCELRREGIYALAWQWGMFVKNLSEKILHQPEVGPQHAAERETSIMLKIAEELVDKEAFDEAGRLAAPIAFEYGTRVSFDLIDVSEGATTGDPRLATREAGEQFYNAAVEGLIGLVRWLESQTEEALQPKGHKP